MSDITERFQGFTARRHRAATGEPAPTPVTPTRVAGPSRQLLETTTRLPLPSTNSSPGSPVVQTTPIFPPQHSPTNPFVTQPAFTTPALPPAIPVLPPAMPAPPPQAPAAAVTTTPPTNSNDELAKAIALLAATLQSPAPPSQPHAHESKNVRDPDRFDGSDPTKLRQFFAQLELVFKARPVTFRTDERKVTYAISYLQGTAQNHFEPYLLERHSPNPPVFLSDYDVFQEELQINFGPYDATGQAEHDLTHLRMSESQRIAKYITNFSRLATQVRWGTAALRFQFYSGLPTRLKDRISEVGKPNTLHGLRDLAQSLDHRYWERKSEQARESSGPSKSATKSNSDSKPTSSSPKTGNHSGNHNSSSSPSKPATPAPPKTPAKTPPKPYADKLGKDGKLTPEERQRRFANNLCLRCGGSGHTAANCTVPAKARAAQVPAAPPTVAPAAAPVAKN